MNIAVILSITIQNKEYYIEYFILIVFYKKVKLS